ncbi:MAG: hypothetical protein ACD_39C00498G0005 [uncultured bacterium]|nr:MAG: hypothetical protein ACD_39C00498G0005 [uncultured bacterium]
MEIARSQRKSFETGNIDAIPTAPTSTLRLSIAVANGPLSSSGYAALMTEAIRAA